MWLNDLLPPKRNNPPDFRPTSPTMKNLVGRPQSLDSVGSSDTSDTSDKKTCAAWLKTGKRADSSDLQTKNDTALFEKGLSVRHLGNKPSPLAGLHAFPARGKPNPWPVLWHLVESFNCNPLVMDQWPASVVLCFAPGVLASEKRAALRYAVDNWQALLADMALPADGSIRHCWIEGFEFYCRPGNVKEAVIC